MHPSALYRLYGHDGIVLHAPKHGVFGVSERNEMLNCYLNANNGMQQNEGCCTSGEGHGDRYCMVTETE